MSNITVEIVYVEDETLGSIPNILITNLPHVRYSENMAPIPAVIIQIGEDIVYDVRDDIDIILDETEETE